jgi:aryl-alcohol dehydrogenase-like predicted oxidoreductase
LDGGAGFDDVPIVRPHDLGNLLRKNVKVETQRSSSRSPTITGTNQFRRHAGMRYMNNMNYQLLGRSGLRVSDLCLGTMTFGEDWGWGAAKDEARKIYDGFREAGGNFIDTANLYTNGASERFVGEFIAGCREEVVVATKYTNAAPGKDANAGGNQRKNMAQAVEASLRRLGTDYLDLYWLHIWDQITPAEEVMRAFDDLVRAGKVLYIGVSDAPAWVVAKSNTLAELRGWTRYVGLQIEYSLLERTVERETGSRPELPQTCL